MIGSKTLILTSTYPADLTPPTSRRHQQLRRRFMTILHAAGLVGSLIAISLFAAAIPRWNANFFHNKGPNRGDWTDGMPLGPLVFAFLYHASVLVHAQIQKSRGTDVSLGATASLSPLSLIIHTAGPTVVLLSLFASLLLAAYGSLFRFWQPAVRTQNGLLICNMLNIFSKECQPTLYDIGNLQIAGIVFGILVWILHFTLLLVSLRNLRRTRLAKQLQREKIAQYARNERRSSRGSLRSHGSRGGSTDSYGTRSQSSWPQSSRKDRYRGSGTRTPPSSNSIPWSGPGSRSNSLLGESIERRDDRAASLNHQQQELPIVLVQAPEQAHPPLLKRPSDDAQAS